MQKLLRLKAWLSVADAARHLEIVFGEKVSPADVLQLGLGKRLRLSVYFVNPGYAVRGKIARMGQAEDEVSLELEDELVTLDGLYDLPMIGDERLNIQTLHQMASGGPSVEMKAPDGALVQGADGQLFQIRETVAGGKHRPASLYMDDCMVVVRPGALREFEEAVQEAPTNWDSTLG